ncbi:NAD binding Rossmann fold oxidoreductase [Cyathus striatus]|nr:NAD binding Rossmann fold oxidoreductase [Cyathus striatus]
MALALQMYTFIQQYLTSWAHQVPQKSSDPIKLGILSTAQINSASVIDPIATHPEITIHGIASRTPQSSQSYAKKYKIPHSYPTYTSLLADSELDAVYISLPNALHFEWAAKALRAGKHVLLEKPFTSNAVEAKKLIEIAKESGKILLEAFHWQFHPAAHLFRSILAESSSGGRILKTDSIMSATPSIPPGDIRWQYDLGGGSLMDMTYTLSFTRFALGGRKPEEVIHAKAQSADDPRVDKSMKATLRFPGKEDESVYSEIYTDMDRDKLWGVVPRVWELPTIRVEMENREVVFYNAMMPHLYHYIQVKEKKTGRVRVEKAYAPRLGESWKGWKGESWWSTYRYQLEAFVDKIKGRTPSHWIPHEESIAQMESIDMVYHKAGLPLRPTSTFVEGV